METSIPDKERPLDLISIKVGGAEEEAHQDFSDSSEWVNNHKHLHHTKLLLDVLKNPPSCHRQSAWSSHDVSFDHWRTQADMSGPRNQHSSPDSAGPSSHTTVEIEKLEERQLEEEEEYVAEVQDADIDLELRGQDLTFDSTGWRSYMKACGKLHVVPSSAFLRQIQSNEMLLMHCCLGPRGSKALAVSLETNTSVLKLNLRDNWMEGMGGAAIAAMLKENCYITEVDLSDNNLGDCGARAVADMLQKNSTLAKIRLSGNNFTDEAAEQLAQALTVNTRLQHLDLSHNALAEHAGQILGATLSENTGLRSISLAWNYIRGRGAVVLANSLGGNIFLRSIDLSFNGFGKEGAVALGQALRENEVLEELNVSNNRIPPDGAIHLAMGLKHNKTIRILQIGRNPIHHAGCYGILQSLHENPDSAIETLDFSDITVSHDFEDLYTAVKAIFPMLTVNHGGKIGTFTKQKHEK